MKRTVIIFSALMFSVVISAQGVDFSGIWKLNTSKSKLGQEFSMAPKEIVITQSGNDFKLEKHSSFQDQEFIINEKFTLDGKECINPGWQDSQKKSTAVWSEDNKSLKIITKMPMGDGGEMTITEIYKMDGANMLLDSASSSSFGELAETMVYDRQ